ncbi:MAG: hypothetical protein ACTMII_06815 [Brachybacterium sp.]
MTSLPLFAAAAPPPRPRAGGTTVSRWGDELSRHHRLSLAAGAALTLTVLAVALSMTVEGITHLSSLLQLLAVSVLLVISQAGALAATLPRSLALRALGTVAGVVVLLLMNAIGFGGLWIVPVATAVVLLLRSSPASWRRLLAAGTTPFAAAAIAMWANGLAASALVRTPILLTSLLALAAGTLLLVNYLAGRDTWGAILLASAATLGMGGLLSFMGSTLEAAAADEDSLTSMIYGLGMLGMKKLDLLLPILVVPVIAIIALIRLRGGSSGETGWAPEEASPAVSAAALGLAVLTLLPALVGVLSDDASALLGLLIDTVYMIGWVLCLVLWFSLHRDVVGRRLPLTALSLDHALVISLIVLSPLLRGVLTWLGLMIEGAPLYESL